MCERAIRALQSKPGVMSTGADPARRAAPPAPPASHPEAVDRSLEQKLAEAVRLLHMLDRPEARHPDVAAFLDGLDDDILSSSPPSLLRTAEQEREAVVRWIRDWVEKDDRPCGGAASAQRVILRWVAGVFEHGDHLQPTGSEGDDHGQG